MNQSSEDPAFHEITVTEESPKDLDVMLDVVFPYKIATPSITPSISTVSPYKKFVIFCLPQCVW